MPNPPSPRIPGSHIPLMEKDGTISRPWQRYMTTAQNPYFPITPNLTALAGGGQPGATILTFGTNLIVVCAVNGDSSILPPATGSAMIVVAINLGAANLAVFPAVGERIALVALNTSITVNTGKTAVFVDGKLGQWGGGTLG